MTITYDSIERRRGETPDGAEQTGDVHLFRAVDDEHDAAVTLGYVDWAGAERHVELVDIEQGPTELHHLQGRRRLTIRPDAYREYVELRQLRIQTEAPAPWSTLRKASEEELDEERQSMSMRCCVASKPTLSGLALNYSTKDLSTAAPTCVPRSSRATVQFRLRRSH